jgi:hypothetical protein
MSLTRIVGIAASTLSLIACGQSSGDSKGELASFQLDVKKEIHALRERIDAAGKSNETLEQKGGELEAQATFAAMEASERKTASFDSQGDKAYGAVETNLGMILFVLEKLEPYLDGYTVTFRVGNPTAATLNGFDAKLSWGPKFDGKDKATWKKQSKDVKVTTSIPPGSWWFVTVNIGPASPQQARTIEITPRFNNVAMRTVQR